MKIRIRNEKKIKGTNWALFAQNMNGMGDITSLVYINHWFEEACLTMATKLNENGIIKCMHSVSRSNSLSHIKTEPNPNLMNKPSPILVWGAQQQTSSALAASAFAASATARCSRIFFSAFARSPAEINITPSSSGNSSSFRSRDIVG
jgi:hypothetical protein